MKVLTHERHLGCPSEIPDELLNEDWAKNIHGQTLKRLNERGGLSPAEVYGNIKRLSFHEICALKDADCVKWLKDLAAQPTYAIPPQQKQGDEYSWDMAWHKYKRETPNEQRSFKSLLDYLEKNYNLTKK